ncbi:hypothetical protein [Streptomyces sp. Y7]
MTNAEGIRPAAVAMISPVTRLVFRNPLHEALHITALPTIAAVTHRRSA